MNDSAEFPVWSIKASFPSVLGEGRSLVERVVAEMEHRGWSDRDVFAVNLAMEESFTNAIEHGNHCDPRKEFHVNCMVDSKLVKIVVRDEGEGFSRDCVPNPLDEENMEIPSGRGLLLIRGFMTSVTYNEAGNEVSMTKEPSSSDPLPEQ